jgi:hypothetical protein
MYHCKKHGNHLGHECKDCLIEEGRKALATKEKRNAKARKRYAANKKTKASS